MSLKTKLIAFLCSFIFLIAFWSILIYQLGNIQQSLHQLSKRYELIVKYADETKNMTTRTLLIAFSVITNPEITLKGESDYQLIQSRTESVFIEWETLFDQMGVITNRQVDAELRKHFLSIKREFQRVNGIFYQILALVKSQKQEQALLVLHQEQSDVFVTYFSEIEKKLITLRARQEQELFEQYTRTQNMIIGSFVLFLPGIILVTVILIRHMILSLNLLLDGVRWVTKRKLSERLPIRSRDEFGQLSQAFNRMIDQLQETTISRAYFENVIQSMRDALIVTDAEGKIQMINPASLNLLGGNKEQLLNRSILNISGKKLISMDIWIRLQQERAIVNFETSLQWEDKEQPTPIMLSASLLTTKEKSSGTVWVFQDISSLKNAEEKVKQLNRVLEKRVEERTAELQDSLDILKQTHDQLIESEKMAALGELVAGIAHEINTPIGIGVTAASFLELESRKLDKTFQEGKLRKSDLTDFLDLATESSSVILNNLNRAAELIQSFKQVAVDRSSHACRQIDFREFLDEVFLSLRPKLKRTGHKITLDCPENLKILSYPGAFSQIVTNLVMNTLLHGFEGLENGEIQVTLSVTDETLFFLYRDNGKGMDEESLRKLYLPFFTTKRGLGGTGLGMNIVYNLVTQTLGGNIQCSSTLGEGVEVLIKVPIPAYKAPQDDLLSQHIH